MSGALHFPVKWLELSSRNWAILVLSLAVIDFLCALGQDKLSVPQPALSVPWDTQRSAPAQVHCEPQTIIVCKTPSSSAGKCCKNWELSGFNCSSVNGPQKKADLTLLLLLTKKTCTLSPRELQRFRGGC